MAVTEGVTLSGVRKDEDCERVGTLETPGQPGAEGASVQDGNPGVNLSGKRTKFVSLIPHGSILYLFPKSLSDG